MDVRLVGKGSSSRVGSGSSSNSGSSGNGGIGLVALRALRPNDVLGVMGGYVLPAGSTTMTQQGSSGMMSGPLRQLLATGHTACRYRDGLPEALRGAPLAAAWQLLVHSFLRPISAAAMAAGAAAAAADDAGDATAGVLGKPRRLLAASVRSRQPGRVR